MIIFCILYGIISWKFHYWGCMIVTFLFYELLKYLNTPNLMFSTVSIATSFLAATLTMLRSSYYALGYASNDIVLIILWVMASIKDPSYFSVVVNFMIFFLNDMYGFISWKKREAKIEEKIEIG